MLFRISNPIIAAFTVITVGSCCCGEATPPPTLTPPPAKNSPDQQKSQPKIVCPMEWTSPTTSFDAGDMPPTGMVPFDWTDNPGTSDYDMTVITPNGSPVDYDVDGSEKDLFMENYTQTGNYQVVVTALGPNGEELCSITMNFNLPVASTAPKPSGDGDGGGNDDNNNNPSIIPSNPITPEPTQENVPR